MSDSTGVYLDDVDLQDSTFSTAKAGYIRKEVGIATDTGGSSRSYSWGVYLCIAIVLALFIFAVISSVGLGRSTNNQHILNTYIAEWHQAEEERNQHAELPSTTVSVGKEDRSITLCVSQTYHQSKEGFKPLLGETIEEIRQSEMNQHEFYHFNARIQLIVASKKDNGVRQLTLFYNLTSTLFPFSSIRLEELEFNTRTNRIGSTRNIVMCSNNPDLNAVRCDDESLIEHHLFTLRGIEIVPFLMSSREQKIETESTVELKEGHKLGLRMYNIVFYQDGSNATILQNKESRILTLEPLQC